MTTLDDIERYMKVYDYDQVTIGLHSDRENFVILRSARNHMPAANYGKGASTEAAWVDLMSKEGSPRPKKPDAKPAFDLGDLLK